MLAYTRRGTFLNIAPAVQQALPPVVKYDDPQPVNDALCSSSETGADDSEKKDSMDSNATWTPSESEETDLEHCPGVLWSSSHHKDNISLKVSDFLAMETVQEDEVPPADDDNKAETVKVVHKGIFEISDYKLSRK